MRPLRGLEAAPAWMPGSPRRSTPRCLPLSSAQQTAACAAQGQAALTVYGSAVHLAPGASAVYDPDFQLLNLPLTGDVAEFAALEVHSDLFTPAGVAQVAGSNWAFPVTIASAASLGGRRRRRVPDAGTWGGLGPRRGKAQRTVSLLEVPCCLPPPAASPLSPRSLARRASGSALACGKHSREALAGLTLTGRATSRPVFVAEGSADPGNTGMELLAAEAAISASLDRPLTFTGARTPAGTTARTLVFMLRTVPGFLLLFDMALGDAPLTFGYALENAALITTGAIAMAFAASYDGTDCPDGLLALSFGLRQFLPSLPDPYAASFDLALDRGKGVVSEMLAFVGWKESSDPQLEYLLPPLPRGRVAAASGRPGRRAGSGPWRAGDEDGVLARRWHRAARRLVERGPVRHPAGGGRRGQRREPARIQ